MAGKREGDQWKVGLALGGLGAQGRGGEEMDPAPAM